MDFEEVIRQPSPRNPSQKKSSVRVKAHCANDETLILCISSERVEKDRAIRIKQEQRFLRDVAKVQARIQNGQLKKDVKIGEAIGRLRALSSGSAISRADLGCDDAATRKSASRRKT